LFPGAAHQVCQFHVLKEITQAVLHAVAKVRKELKAQQPPLPRGRPSKAHQAAARKAKRIQQRIADLFDHRHLFVQHHLTPAEKKIFQRITRGLPHLRTLRQIMDEVYRLFDRRCRTETALDKLARLRRRVRRFQRVGRTLNKLFTPNLQKALTFLDDRPLPATSNAVERSNRRFRKAQRSVYCVRTAQNLATASGDEGEPAVAEPAAVADEAEPALAEPPPIEAMGEEEAVAAEPPPFAPPREVPAAEPAAADEPLADGDAGDPPRRRGRSGSRGDPPHCRHRHRSGP
jgi:hypothetical protein